ncbi:MAG: hypothetical protein LAKADJCE_00676 [Candidatus Argoarchaeum ethanivorans]|uniref:Uncharacterized protein n=1 Tax=Candidatus Argoarchaeum ethanivorans TaxID=2608793 RepID=A0A811T9X3_9EURY|nr:MAG: hypothetical protein LAKADJCE_00676 [Candidatus Argoarchaeum ethanivorans]
MYPTVTSDSIYEVLTLVIPGFCAAFAISFTNSSFSSKSMSLKSSLTTGRFFISGWLTITISTFSLGVFWLVDRAISVAVDNALPVCLGFSVVAIPQLPFINARMLAPVIKLFAVSLISWLSRMIEDAVTSTVLMS